MSSSNDNCSVNIYVKNETNIVFTLSEEDCNRHHGKTNQSPNTRIDASSGKTLIASFGKKSGYGPLGWIGYKDTNGNTVYFYLNNPEEEGKFYQGVTFASSALGQYFYALIKPQEGNALPYYMEVSNWSAEYPPDITPETVMNPVVTIKKA